jgi:hypothetical protein
MDTYPIKIIILSRTPFNNAGFREVKDMRKINLESKPFFKKHVCIKAHTYVAQIIGR